MKKVSIILMLVTVFSKIFGFFREMMLANLYSNSVIADAFIYAFSLPNTLFSIVITAFVTGFIPMMAQIESQEGEDETRRFINNTLNVMLLIVVIVSSIVFVFADPLLRHVLLRGASEELLTLTIPFVKVAIFSTVFSCIVQLMTGFLQLKDAFIFPMLLGFPMNLVLILALYLSKTVGVSILPIGILLCYVIQAILILGYARFKGFRYQLHIDFKDPKLRRMLILAVPLIIGSASSSIGGIVFQSMASTTDGNISILNYATKLGIMIDGVFGVAITSVMYPNLSRAISLNQHEKAENEFMQSMISILLFVVPAAVGMFLLARPIVYFIFFRGSFDETAVNIMVPVLQAYVIGLPFISLYNLLVKVFFSYQDTKTPLYAGIVLLITFIISAAVLRALFGVVGLSMSLGVATFVAVVMLFVVIRKRFSHFNYGKFLSQLVKLLIATGVMSAVLILIQIILGGKVSASVNVVISMIVAMGIYLGAILLLHLETVDQLINSIRFKVKG